MIERLKRDVEQEYSEALSTFDLQERLDMLRKEVIKTRTSLGRPIGPVLEEKIHKIKEGFTQRLTEAPNLVSLNSKLQMLKELIDAKEIAQENNRLMALKHDINKGFQSALDQSNLKEERKLLRAEISGAGVTKVEDLDEGLKEKIQKMKQDIISSLSQALKPMQLNIEQVLPKEETFVVDYVEQQRQAALKEQISELNEQISQEIVEVINTSDLKSKIDKLKLEAAMAGKSSEKDLKTKLEELKQQTSQRVEAALSTSHLAEHYEMLMQEIINSRNTSRFSPMDDEVSEGDDGKQMFSHLDMVNDINHNRSLI